MARLSRITHKIFGSTSGANGVFGSAADGTKVISTSLATLMSKAAWLTGWGTATIGASKYPAIEEMNAVDNVHSTQIGYLLQQGIPEYDAGTTYYQNNIVVNPSTYQLFGSVTDNNLGNALSSGANWQLLCDLSTIGNSYTTQAVVAGSVTLSSTQSAAKVINVTGTMTGNVSLKLASTAYLGSWLVVNNTTGNFALSFGYPTGSTVVISRGKTARVWGDGTNIYSSDAGVIVNDNASSGIIGEYIEQLLPLASAVSVSSGTPTQVTSLSLTAGDWEVGGIVVQINGSGANFQILGGFLVNNGGATPTGTANTMYWGSSTAFSQGASTIPVAASTLPLKPIRVTLSATTQINLMANSTFASGSVSAYGMIHARRVR